MDPDLQEKIESWTPDADGLPQDADWFPPLFEKASFGIAAIDMQGYLVRVNDAFCELHGRTRSEMQSMNITDFAAAEDVGDYESNLAAGREGVLERYENEHVIRRPDGTVRWARVTATTVNDTNGQAAYALVQYHETTDVHRAENVVRETTETLDVTWQTAPIAIYSVDLEGKVTSWNHQAEKIFGWKAEEIVGREIPIVVDRPDAEDGLVQLIEGKTITAIEAVLSHRDGRHLDVITSASVVHTPEGLPKEIMAFTVDVSRQKEVERELTAAEQRMRTIFLKISDAVTVIDGKGTIKYSTGQWSDVLGYDPDFWLDHNALELVHPDDADRADALLQDSLDFPGIEFTDVMRLRHSDGRYVPSEIIGINLLDDPDVEGIVVTSRNLTEFRRTQELLSAEARTLGMIARGESLDRTLQSITDMVERNTLDGRSGVALIGDDGLLHVTAATNIPSDLVALVEGREPYGLFELALERRETVIVTDSDLDPNVNSQADIVKDWEIRSGWITPVTEASTGDILGLICTYFNNTEGPTDDALRVAERGAQLAAIAIDRQRVHDELHRRANYDPLTGLPNRSLVLERLESALSRAARLESGLAVMFLDLDRFKVINDSMGHSVGDRLLVAFAERLISLVRPHDIVGRLSADEFIVVLPDVATAAEVAPLALRLNEALSEPFRLEGAEIQLSASVGVAHSSAGASAAQLLEQADAAMYRAKELGRDRLEVFDDRLRTRARERLQLEQDLRQAVDEGQLVVHYQPGIDLTSGRICGVEALLRWPHPERGTLLPGDFIPTAEDTGLIVPIGRYVLDQAVGQAREWAQHLPDLDGFMVAVNFSARELNSPGMAFHVADVLRRYSWPPELLSMELTESILIDDADSALRALQQLKEIGIMLAIDDFGTGYSSLSYLHRFPVDIVKIDRAFITPLHADGTGSAVTTAVMHMADALDIKTSAEGVETPEQLDGLRKLSCHSAQGFLFSKALPAADLRSMLEAKPAW